MAKAFYFGYHSLSGNLYINNGRDRFDATPFYSDIVGKHNLLDNKYIDRAIDALAREYGKRNITLIIDEELFPNLDHIRQYVPNKLPKANLILHD